MYLRVLIRNGSLNVLGWIANLAAGLACWGLMAHALAPQALGVYSYAVWLSAVFATAATLGLPYAGQKYVAECVGKNDLVTAGAVSWKLLRVNVIATAVALVAAFAVVWWRPFGDRLIDLLVVLAVLPGALQASLRGLITGHQRFERANGIAIITAVAQVAMVAAAVVLHGGVAGLMVANLVAATMSVVLYGWALRPLLGSSRAARDSVWTRQAVWRAWFALSYLFVMDRVLWDKSEVFFLKHWSTIGEVAFYSVAFALTAKVITLGQTFSDLLLPLSAHAYGRASTAGLAEVYSQSSRLLLLFYVPVCTAGIVAAPAVITLLCGRDYASARLPLQIFLAGVPLASLSESGWAAVIAAGLDAALIRMMTAGAVLNVAADYLLVRRYGASGAAVATMVAQCFVAIAIAIAVSRILPGAFPWKTLLNAYIASAITIGPAMALTDSTGRLIAATLGLCVYPVALLVVGEIHTRNLATGIDMFRLRARAMAD